jgi:hypothetical protein
LDSGFVNFGIPGAFFGWMAAAGAAPPTVEQGGWENLFFLTVPF